MSRRGRKEEVVPAKVPQDEPGDMLHEEEL
jgi:hypothetical protein